MECFLRNLAKINIFKIHLSKRQSINDININCYSHAPLQIRWTEYTNQNQSKQKAIGKCLVENGF